MLTGKMVRVRYARDRIVPYYLDARDESLLLAAEQLLELYRGMEGRTRGELEEVAVGSTDELELDLTAGTYALICNIYDETEQEAHYQEGMRAEFTVTE